MSCIPLRHRDDLLTDFSFPLGLHQLRWRPVTFQRFSNDHSNPLPPPSNGVVYTPPHTPGALERAPSWKGAPNASPRGNHRKKAECPTRETN